MGTLLLALILQSIVGCGPQPVIRQIRTEDELATARRMADERQAERLETATTRLLARLKAKQDAHDANHDVPPPIVDFLIISGGGDWGAFAAGFLKGWSRVPPGPMAKPQFDAVTGVSTGALIAPFAFLGDPASTETIVHLYRNPQKDWVKPRGFMSLLRGGNAYADIPGLERALCETVDLPCLQRIVDAAGDGRVLAVNTTNIDNQEMHIWDIVDEARQAVDSGKIERVHDVLLASAAIPGVFPPREIDGVLYVDGGLTGNVIFGGSRARVDRETFAMRWRTTYPGTAVPRIRYWIIFNNEVRWPPEVVPASWSAVFSRSLTASTRSATLTSIRLLMLQAENAKLKNHADVEVRMVAVPDGWAPPKPGVFVKETMNALADLGEQMGADPQSWRTSLPQLEQVD